MVSEFITIVTKDNLLIPNLDNNIFREYSNDFQTKCKSSKKQD